MGESVGDLPRFYAAVVQYLLVLGRRLCALFRAQEGLTTNVVHPESRGAGAGSEFVGCGYFQPRHGLCRRVGLQVASHPGKRNEERVWPGVGWTLLDKDFYH